MILVKRKKLRSEGNQMKLKGLFILDEVNFDMIYPGGIRRKIESLVDIFSPVTKKFVSVQECKIPGYCGNGCLRSMFQRRVYGE